MKMVETFHKAYRLYNIMHMCNNITYISIIIKCILNYIIIRIVLSIYRVYVAL